MKTLETSKATVVNELNEESNYNSSATTSSIISTNQIENASKNIENEDLEKELEGIPNLINKKIILHFIQMRIH